jgi:hypothetical protein
MNRTIEIPDTRACAEENFGFAPDGHVAGRLTGSEGGPLRQVVVELTRADARPHPDYGLSRETTRTDEDGFFDMTGLPPGRYIFGVNLGGVPTEYSPYARIVYPGPPNDAYVIDLALGQTVDLGTWQLPPPVPVVRVDGVVIDRNGAAMSGVYVHAFDVTDGSIDRGRGVTGATSAADGRFTLELHQGRVYSFNARAKDVMLAIRAPRLETGTQSRSAVQITVIDVRK